MNDVLEVTKTVECRRVEVFLRDTKIHLEAASHCRNRFMSYAQLYICDKHNNIIQFHSGEHPVLNLSEAGISFKIEYPIPESDPDASTMKNADPGVLINKKLTNAIETLLSTSKFFLEERGQQGDWFFPEVTFVQEGQIKGLEVSKLLRLHYSKIR